MQLSNEKVVIVDRNNKVVYQDGDRTVKVFNAEKKASDIFNEALNVARITDAKIRAPRVLEVSQLDDGSWGIALERIPGTTLQHLMEESYGTPQFDGYLKLFVDLQVAIQQTPAPELLTKQNEKTVEMISRVKDLDPTTRYDLEMRADQMKAGRCICHGDFNPSNVIVSDVDGELYVCDWAHVTMGLGEADAAMTYIQMSLLFPDKADEYLNMYSLTADVPKQRIHYWLPVVAAAELSRNRKEKEEFLNNWISASSDYE